MTFYEMVKDKPAFKRYCARQSTRPIAKPKRFRVPIPKPKGPLSVLGEYKTGRMIRCSNITHAYDPDKPDGKGEQTVHQWVIEETAVLKKINGEFISILQNPGDLPVEVVSQAPYENWEFGVDPATAVEPLADDDEESETDLATLKLLAALEQQNALLRQLAERV